MNKKQCVSTACFIAAEFVLYYLILTGSGTLLWVSQFVSVALCFAYSLIGLKDKTPLIPIGLAFTVAADYFLVVHSPQEKLWGMVFFLGTQYAYALMLHREKRSKGFFLLRGALSAVAVLLPFIVLGGRVDALSVVSLCYYANLIMNIAVAFHIGGAKRLFAFALSLFFLCDTVVGLQVAAGGYLPIDRGSLLHKIIFMPFNLSWFFYLPSQVMIAVISSLGVFKKTQTRSLLRLLIIKKALFTK